jgi:hypothetical protein
MNNDDNTCGSINMENYVKTLITFDDYEKNYKPTIKKYIAQEIERAKKIIEKYDLKWYGLDGATRGYSVNDMMEKFEDDISLVGIAGDKNDYIEEDNEVLDLIKKIKQGKLRIKKSK